MENRFMAAPSPGEEPDFSKVIEAGSMKAVYENIYTARCDCGGKQFPSGPVTLDSPDKTKEHVSFKMMILNCSTCLKETRQVFAVDTSTKEFHDEQVKGRMFNQRWGRLASGNPIDTENL